ncbi:major tail tube protein [Xanthomonas phage XAJ2]|uniref:Major tail tube protein n=1 Tax=Xanthomonas phage XAJ2 TaxID=1775249 RepID=A0A1I9L2E5_9CAUD|nr:major tail tube protein [Xanthomonas phage XAJ2]
MAICKSNKIDSNITGLYIAEEVCPAQLPTQAVDGFTPVWYGREPNTYSDFGGDPTLLARNPIDPTRQNKRGTISDNDASGGWNEDVTKTNFTRFLQGFFFADARRKVSTESFTLGVPNVALTAVTASNKTYAAAAGLGGFNTAGALVFANGFASAANNGLKTIASATASTVVVSETIVDEAAPPAAAKLTVVGFQFAAADAAITVVGGITQLTATAKNLTTLGLIVGEWVFIGGDLIANRFANNVGFARVASISAGVITFDDVTWPNPVAEAGTGKQIRIFFGTVLKNEALPELIKRRTYSIERTLGVGPQAENATDQQAEYLEGSTPNEFTLNISQADKVNADVTFVSVDNTYRSGAAGDKLKEGTRIPGLSENAFNTSSDVYRIKMNVLDPTTSAPLPLFAFVSEATVSINNGIEPVKAVGALGAIDMSAGNFEVGGSVTAFFQGVNASRAVRNNSDAAFNVILSSQNAGMVFDIPLMGLGGGRLNVEAGSAITVPLEPSAAANKNGYTMLYNNFPYLPSIAVRS